MVNQQDINAQRRCDFHIMECIAHEHCILEPNLRSLYQALTTNQLARCETIVEPVNLVKQVADRKVLDHLLETALIRG